MSDTTWAIRRDPIRTRKQHVFSAWNYRWIYQLFMSRKKAHPSGFSWFPKSFWNSEISTSRSVVPIELNWTRRLLSMSLSTSIVLCFLTQNQRCFSLQLLLRNQCFEKRFTQSSLVHHVHTFWWRHTLSWWLHDTECAPWLNGISWWPPDRSSMEKLLKTLVRKNFEPKYTNLSLFQDL